MTDKPRTMMLQPYEWRSLVATGAQNIYSMIGSLTAEAPPTQQQMIWLHDTLDRLKMQVSAWGASGLQQPAAPDPTISITAGQGGGSGGYEANNGTGITAAEPKKKRGWQKGRKRGPRKPKQSEAVQ